VWGMTFTKRAGPRGPTIPVQRSHFVATANACWTRTLPGEGLVLSALLGPFFWSGQEWPGDGDFEGEDERVFHIDIFELAIQTQAASDEVCFVSCDLSLLPLL
jgi:hypothetical protein